MTEEASTRQASKPCTTEHRYRPTSTFRCEDCDFVCYYDPTGMGTYKETEDDTGVSSTA
ncbi:hypothetical protein CJF31_00000159 [Rutstroemia sp. NJR-2017a BVV2]|nr:hypothetical protein CJF31_00000159 [Rutstroemia sp. NJR-2017a BVV2]